MENHVRQTVTLWVALGKIASMEKINQVRSVARLSYPNERSRLDSSTSKNALATVIVKVTAEITVARLTSLESDSRHDS